MQKNEIIYENYCGLLEKEARKCLKDLSHTEDVINDTFIHILLHRHWFEKQNEAVRQKYAISVCQKECEKYDSWRQQSDVCYIDSRPKDGADSEMKDFLQKNEIEEILAELDSKTARIIRDFYLEGKSIAKIAALYGITYENAAGRLSRARKKIKKITAPSQKK